VTSAAHPWCLKHEESKALNSRATGVLHRRCSIDPCRCGMYQTVGGVILDGHVKRVEWARCVVYCLCVYTGASDTFPFLFLSSLSLSLPSSVSVVRSVIVSIFSRVRFLNLGIGR